MEVTQLALTWVGWPNIEKLAFTCAQIWSRPKWAQVITTGNKAWPNEDANTPKFPLGSTCDSVWPGLYGSCTHQNKPPIQGDERNYHDSLRACLIEGDGHSTQLERSKSHTEKRENNVAFMFPLTQEWWKSDFPVRYTTHLVGISLAGRHPHSYHYCHIDRLGHSSAPQDNEYTKKNHLDSKTQLDMAFEFWFVCSSTLASKLWVQFFQGGKMCHLDTPCPRNCCLTGDRSCQRDRGSNQLYYVLQCHFGRFHLDRVLGCL